MGPPSSVTNPLQSATVSIPSKASEGSGSDDASKFIAFGTPFQRPKIADSIIDTIGATPLVCVWANGRHDTHWFYNLVHLRFV